MFRLLCPFPRVRTAVNIDFGLDPVFSWYVVLLCISGIAMLAIAAIKSSGQSTAARAFNALVGVGFLGYGDLPRLHLQRRDVHHLLQGVHPACAAAGQLLPFARGTEE